MPALCANVSFMWMFACFTSRCGSSKQNDWTRELFVKVSAEWLALSWIR